MAQGPGTSPQKTTSEIGLSRQALKITRKDIKKFFYPPPFEADDPTAFPIGELVPEPPEPAQAPRVSVDEIKSSMEDGSFTGTIPKVWPVFTGLQAWILERRERHIQSKLEPLEKSQKTMRYIGTRILQGKGYLSYDPDEYKGSSDDPDKYKGCSYSDIDRPHRASDRLSGNLLNMINRRLMRVNQRAFDNYANYPENAAQRKKDAEREAAARRKADAKGEATDEGERNSEHDKGRGLGDPDKRSRAEQRIIKKAARKKLEEANEKRGRMVYAKLFRYIVTRPGRKVEGLAEKQRNLAIKLAALRWQQEAEHEPGQYRTMR